ncbi:MAG: class I SAM-dependent methyltransferase [Desulfobacterales bacterium]|nr:MAG: class I SAM-dependent methyltransferase [Desulfobacterales bacterium]
MVTVDFDRLAIQAGFKILDIGCGTGRHTCKAFQCAQVTAIGADLNLTDLSEARQRLQYQTQLGNHRGGVWALAVADVTRLPFKSNHFDLVICSEVMEHVRHHRAAVQEVIRVLKPAHHLALSVPRFWPERVCWALSKDYHRVPGGHIRIYRKGELITLLERYGVRKWATHYAHSLHTPYWWLKCLVGPSRQDSTLVNLYHRFLTWDIMRRPNIIRLLDRLLNPLLGKSLVLYFEKKA